MRIDRLDLKRFGCFTDMTLDLSNPGTHLVVGLNEAGKTTAMAAIRQLLFGIPVRSTHAFLHDMRDLCLGAVLRDDSGETLEITRVKRQSGTLRRPQGEILDEAVLARFCHGVDETVYASLFTIAHDEIARGGEALLVSDGELGRALFSASRATTDLNAVLRKLDERAASLFKSAASIPKLNAAIRDYKDEIVKVKQCSTSASEVVRLEAELSDAHADYEFAGARRLELAQRKTQLERVRATRPQLAERHDCLLRKGELERSGHLVDLALHALLDDATATKRDGDSQRRAAQAAIDRLDEKLSGLSIDSTLLAARDEIDQLRDDSGGYRQNLEDLPDRLARASSLQEDLVELRQRLPDRCPLGPAGKSGLTVDQEERIRLLAEARTKLEAHREDAATQVLEAMSSLDELAAQIEALETPADTATLVEVATRVRKAGDLEAARTDAARQLQTVDATLTNATRKLRLLDVNPRHVDAVAVPSAETIRELRAEFDKLVGTVATLEDQIAELEAKRATTETDLAELLTTEHPLRESDLEAARAKRDDGWRLVRAIWIDGSEEAEAVAKWAAGEPLETAYEVAVREADEVADRLRDDANAVERRASLEKQLEEIDGRLAAQREKLASARAAMDQRETSWTQLWEAVGIVADSRESMEKWRDDFRDCAQLSLEARRLAAEIESNDASIARYRNDLVTTLASLATPPSEGMSLLALLDHADQVAASAIATRQEHASLAKARLEAEKLARRRTTTLARAEKEMASWRADWATAVTTLGLAETASPNEATAILKVLDEITSTARELEDTLERISGMQRRNSTFSKKVFAVLAKLDAHGDLVDAGADVAITTLSNRLAAAQETATEHRTATEERENHDQIRIGAELQIAEANDRIDQMVATTGVIDEAALHEAIARSEEHGVLVTRIAQLDDDLRKATGMTVREVESEAGELAGVEIEPEIDELTREIANIDETLKIQGKVLGELTNKRSMLDASGYAADAMGRAQLALAAVAGYGEEYVQVLLARQLLEEQVAIYRDQHHGPLLARARQLFAKLTLDHYLGLDTDTDTLANPYLLARTGADKLIEIGALSTGTRDQLYLALRLAALEQFIDRRGSLPLVLDDLFVHFDDERTAAGLAVIDNVADRAQVLAFTHHEQVASQAADIIDASRLTVHHLGQ